MLRHALLLVRRGTCALRPVQAASFLRFRGARALEPYAGLSPLTVCNSTGATSTILLSLCRAGQSCIITGNMSSALPFPVCNGLEGDDPYRPKEQGYHYLYGYGWASTLEIPEAPAANLSLPLVDPKAIRLMSWNIDFMAPFPEERMSAALQHLDTLISSTSADIAIVIMLQEMVSSDLVQIHESKWVHERFNVTDSDGRFFTGGFDGYGTTTLIDRRLHIERVFRVPWMSDMGRDGLFVDISLEDSQSQDSDRRVLRLCNTHLESLAADPPIRPTQVLTASQYLQEPGVACALFAGDMNAIQPFDRTLHWRNNLWDAYLALGGQEDREEGFTWGYQSGHWQRNRFGCSRMDKILYRGVLQPQEFQIIGVGVRVAEEHREQMIFAKKGNWATDHYGVMCDFELTDSTTLWIGGKTAEGDGGPK